VAEPPPRPKGWPGAFFFLILNLSKSEFSVIKIKKINPVNKIFNPNKVIKEN
jgi:hypothetical protein